MNMVELRNVNKIYGQGENQIYALKNVTVSIKAGEFVVILGPSGAGKSTLLNILGGIDRADGGQVSVAGEDIAYMKEKQLSDYRARRVGFVFQFYNLIPTLTVKENVGLMKELKSDALSADAVLEKVGLAAHGKKFPGQLSGGEQQRVSIARAVAKNPDILLCDEPTGALDSETGCMVLEELQKLSRQDGKTILIVTHNANIAKAADKVIQVKNGRITDVKQNRQPLNVREVEW